MAEWVRKKSQEVPIQGVIVNDETLVSETDKTLTINAIKRLIQHDNLLINGDFQIWQRGLDFNPAPSVKYTADRWLLYNSDTSRMYYADSLGKGYVNNKGNVHIKQYIEKDSIGDIYTMSFSYRIIGTSLDKFISVTGTMSETAVIKENDDVVIKLGYDSVRKCQYVDIGFKKITEYQLNYAKLEYGKIATPLVPRPHAEELMLCQRYYQDYPYHAIKSIPFINDSTYLHFSFKLVPEMRVPPTLLNDSKFYADGLYRMTDGGYDRISEIIISELSKSNEFSFTVIGTSKLVVGMQYVINNNSVIKGFDAEIY